MCVRPCPVVGVALADIDALALGATGVPLAAVAGAGVASSRRDDGGERVLFPTRIWVAVWICVDDGGATPLRADGAGVAATDDGAFTPGVPARSGDLNLYACAFPPVTVLSATTSVKSRIMALPGACLTTSGSHAHGASDASSFSTLLIFLRLGSSPVGGGEFSFPSIGSEGTAATTGAAAMDSRMAIASCWRSVILAISAAFQTKRRR